MVRVWKSWEGEGKLKELRCSFQGWIEKEWELCSKCSKDCHHLWGAGIAPRVTRGRARIFSWESLGFLTLGNIVVQLLSCVQLFATPWTAAHQTSLSITNSQSLLKLMSIELVMPSNHLILCRPLLLLPLIFPSIEVFPNESVLLIRWPEYWSVSFSISPSNEYSGLISFRTDWFDLLTVKGTLKSLLQHHSLKASVLGHSAFFMVQLSHDY